jgi:phage terminase large subunit-like protein
VSENYIFEYYNKIQKKEIIVGKWIKSIYKIITDGIQNGKYIFDKRKADKAIKFIENFCHHCEGRKDLLKLELWQKSAVSAIFGIVDCDGLRVWREVFIIIGRKNGKSLLAAALIAYVSYMDKEYGAQIYCIATKLQQAKTVYNNFFQMIKSEPELYALTQKNGDEIYIPDLNTSIKPLPFSPQKCDGLNPHLVIVDELAAWKGDAGIKQYKVIKSACGARKQPLIITISTAGFEKDGIFDELRTRATRFLKGDSEERRLLPLMYEIDDDDDWDNLDNLKKSNPNIGVSLKEDFLIESIAAAHGSHEEKVEFITKCCNRKQNSSVAAFEYDDIANSSSDLILADFKNCYAVGGVDLSQTTDLTAASIVIEKSGKFYSFVKFFMPSEKLSVSQARDGVPYETFVKRGFITLSGENFVDYHDVLEWFLQLRNKYQIYPLRVGYDRWQAQYLVKELESKGFKPDDVKQSWNLCSVIREFEGILKDGNFFICENNDLLKAHFLNVAFQHNLETRQYRPVKINQTARIDGFVAVIDAFTVRSKYYSEIGKILRNGGA